MLARSDGYQLATAWRALEGDSEKVGWRSIPVEQRGCYVLRAGRRFPDNLEAILVGVNDARLPSDAQLPKGAGFTVVRADISAEAGRSWLALCREVGADKSFFELMATDILQVLRDKESKGADPLVAAVLSRVIAWQEFMRRRNYNVLSPEEEVGLFGDLWILDALLKHLPARTAIEAWVGPLEGLQDFTFPPGAVEVKTTAAGGPFIARVDSLGQLDTAVVRPLCVAAVRLVQSNGGLTLPDAIEVLRRQLFTDPPAADLFEWRLSRAGYGDESFNRYVRRFAETEVRYLAIEEETPRLVPGSVPPEVRDARYELDLDAIPEGYAELSMVLEALGVC